jgi:glutathione peroxidase-family protein
VSGGGIMVKDELPVYTFLTENKKEGKFGDVHGNFTKFDKAIRKAKSS